MELVDFFPKYPNIRKSEDRLFDLYPNEEFRDVIISKKEFADLKLPRVEKVPDKPGEYFNHQKIISRFLASTTPYDQLLLVHEMGTGKTCTAIACIENVKKDFEGALVFARGEGLLKNFVDELLFKCTDGRYVPKNFKTLTGNQKTRRVGKSVGEYYTFFTFEKFAKLVKGMSDSQIKRKFSNHIIVIDEIHNIRKKDDKTEEQLDIYNQFHRFLHVVENCKIILMSGTPMKDHPSEIADVMNLILPLNDQFEPSTFVQEYFDGTSFKPGKAGEFIEKVSGRVSFLKAMTSSVKKTFVGERMGRLKHFKVWPIVMSKFQSRVYSEAYGRDKREKTISTYSRQAGLFAFPDRSYGTEGYDKYVTRKSVVSMKGTKKTVYALSPELSRAIDKNIEKLREFSCKYADLLENILTNPKQKTFIYCEFVEGGGAILLSLILKHFGYARAFGHETTKALRYAIVTNKTTSARETRKIIDKYNARDNKDGEYISVIIGSRVIAEGYTLKSVSKEVILLPHWNFSETAQAIARGWRVGSHEYSPEITELKIYQVVALTETTPSIDLEMYELSEKKDTQIKEIEYLFKKSAFDCWLNKDRNTKLGDDWSRECDYKRCDYKCIGQPSGDTDVSTYNLYYSRQALMTDHLTSFFKTNYSVTLSDLTAKFPEYTPFEIMKTIRSLVENDVTVIDKYNIPQYIRMDGITVFLSPDPARTSDYLTSFYSRDLIVDTNIDYGDIVAKKMKEDAPNKVKNVFKYPGYVNVIIPALDSDIQLLLLRGCIEAEDKNLEKNVSSRKAVLAYFRGSYKMEEDKWVITSTNPYLILKKGTDEWKPLSKSAIVSDRNAESRSVRSPIGYYGLYNPTLENMFCLRETQDAKRKDLRKVKVGKRCVNFSKRELTDIIARRIKKPVPPGFLGDISKERLKDKASKMNVSVQEDFHGTKDNLKRVVFWGGQSMNTICDNIREWMEENGLVEEDLNCGLQHKRRARSVTFEL